jgi:hypothetical protein
LASKVCILWRWARKEERREWRQERESIYKRKENNARAKAIFGKFPAALT